MEENKKYEIVGKVEIGTDEYRDLVEDRIKFSKEADEYRSKTWKQETEISNLNKKIDELETVIESYKRFIKDKELTEKYKMFVAGITDEK